MMEGKIVIVTGSNSGIGKATAKILAEMGTTVILAVRNRKKGEQVRDEIISKTGHKQIVVMVCDLASRESIKKFVKDFKEKYAKLNVLINNAGAVFAKRQLTIDGIESSIAVNYLGPFQLIQELLPLLKKSAPSRIINVSSGLSQNAQINLEDLQHTLNYRGMHSYANSKLMLTMYTIEQAKRLMDTKVTANVVEPGFVATNLGRNSGSLLNSIMFSLVRPLQITPEKAAENTIYVATSPELEKVTGKIFAKKQEKDGPPIIKDEKIRSNLWEKTLSLIYQESVDMH
jgi:NAD(P)-dependent dehydrogenase (short-subunit alcohol dehydrogenase family)